MATIANLIDGSDPQYPGVIPKLSSNSSVNTIDAQRWLVSAIRNITASYPFDELCVYGPLVPLTIGQNVYTVDTFLPIGYINKVTRIDSFILQVSPGSSANTSFIPLKWRTVSFMLPLAQIDGMVLFYTDYGTSNVITPGKQQILFAFRPVQSYLVGAAFQGKHQFAPSIPDTIVMVPDEWLDVIVGAAALIGAEELRMSDKQGQLKQELYGDPDNRAEPGLIKRLVSARAQFSNINERQFNFISGVK